MSEDKKIIITFFLSVVISVGGITLNSYIERRKRRKDKREVLRYELYGICQSVLSRAYGICLRDLEAKYRYALYKKGVDTEIEKTSYHWYITETERYAEKMHEEISKLITRIGLMNEYWDNDAELGAIKRLIKEANKKPFILMNFENVFNEKMDKDKIESVYRFQQDSIREYINDFSFGRNLLEIQKILDPALAKDKLFQ